MKKTSCVRPVCESQKIYFYKLLD